MIRRGASITQPKTCLDHTGRGDPAQPSLTGRPSLIDLAHYRLYKHLQY